MLDIRLLQKRGQSDLREFAAQVDLSYITLWGNKPFTQPVLVEGQIKDNGDNTYTIEYIAKTSVVFPCGRCLSEKDYSFFVERTYLLKDDLESDDLRDDYYPIKNLKVNLSNLVGSDFIAEADKHTLCKPDCKGLCPKCGVDLNLEECSCTKDENLDPRFDMLRELLKTEFPD